MSDEFYWVAVAVVTVLSASRITRLFVADKFPPTMWLRNTYGEFTDRSDSRRQWQLLLFCGYCFGFWATGLVVTLGLLAEVYAPPVSKGYDDIGFTAWWLANAILGGSYLAAMVMAHDGDDSEDS